MSIAFSLILMVDFMILIVFTSELVKCFEPIFAYRITERLKVNTFFEVRCFLFVKWVL